MNIIQKKHDIQIFKETNKKRRTINQTFLDKENNIYFTPIKFFQSMHYASALTDYIDLLRTPDRVIDH